MSDTLTEISKYLTPEKRLEWEREEYQEEQKKLEQAREMREGVYLILRELGQVNADQLLLAVFRHLGAQDIPDEIGKFEAQRNIYELFWPALRNLMDERRVVQSWTRSTGVVFEAKA